MNTKEELTGKFNRNKVEFDLLWKDFNNGKDGVYYYGTELTAELNNFSKSIATRLKSLAISNVYLQYGNCEKPSRKIFIFETSWNSKVPVIIYRNICDSVGTKKGYYLKDGNGNEAYGLGDLWQVYKEVKVSYSKQ